MNSARSNIVECWPEFKKIFFAALSVLPEVKNTVVIKIFNENTKRLTLYYFSNLKAKQKFGRLFINFFKPCMLEWNVIIMFLLNSFKHKF